MGSIEGFQMRCAQNGAKSAVLELFAFQNFFNENQIKTKE